MKYISKYKVNILAVALVLIVIYFWGISKGYEWSRVGEALTVWFGLF